MVIGGFESYRCKVFIGQVCILRQDVGSIAIEAVFDVKDAKIGECLNRKRVLRNEKLEFLEASARLLFHVHDGHIVKSCLIELDLRSRRHVSEGLAGSVD